MLSDFIVIYIEAARIGKKFNEVFSDTRGLDCRHLMTKTRFWQIKRNIKFARESEMDPNDPNRHFGQMCQVLYQNGLQLVDLGDEHTLDEGRATVKSAKEPFKTYEPNKPIRNWA